MNSLPQDKRSSNIYRNSNINHNFYDNDAEKKTINGFIKLDYDLYKNFKFLIELNKKNIKYNFYGFNENGDFANQNIEIDFLNPKIGFTHKISDNQLSYISIGIANNEPNRNDYVYSSPSSRPNPEKLFDIEAGYKIKNQNLSLSVNTYHMNYKNDEKRIHNKRYIKCYE